MQEHSKYIREPGLIGIGDDVPFELRLAQTIAWCESHTRLAAAQASLRSEELQPRVLEVDRATTVGHVVGYRGTLIGDVRLIDKSEDFKGGRLLLYFPDEELACGAAQVATQGFFDLNNAPPWDTWIGLFRDEDIRSAADYLVSWVPPPFVELVAVGIDVNPERCIEWLSHSDTHVAKVPQESWDPCIGRSS